MAVKDFFEQVQNIANCQLPIADLRSARCDAFSGNKILEGPILCLRVLVVPGRLIANPAADFPTIFTSMFMHGGWLHLLGNMLYLWIFGDNVEDTFGHVKFLVFYLLCGIAATLAQVMFTAGSNVPNLGASGAIAGVLAGYLVLFPRGQVRVMMGRGIIPLPALVVIGFWIVLQFISVGSISETADTGGVAYLAHIGGFVAGLVLTFLFRAGGTRQATV